METPWFDFALDSLEDDSPESAVLERFPGVLEAMYHS